LHNDSKKDDAGIYNIRVINLEFAKIPHCKRARPYEPRGIKQVKGEVWPSPFEGHRDDVYSVAYSPDGKQIASSSEDGTIRLWDVLTGERRTFWIGTRTRCFILAFSPDGTQIAAERCVINLSTDRITNLGDNSVDLSAFSADGRFIASATHNPTACQIWDASTHQTIVELIGHTDFIRSIAFFPDGKQFMSASQDGTIRVSDVELLEERGEMDGWHVKGFQNHDWIFGPKGEYLFWTQLPFRHARNTLVIGECPEIDFSNFVHGDEWVKCREPLYKKVRKG
jgi:WD40 repeat protein